PWLGRLSLVDVAVDDDPSAPTRLAVRLPRVDVSLGIESLWRGRFVLSVALSEPDVAAEGGGNQSSRIDVVPLPESFPIGPVRIRIGTVRVTGGHLVFRQSRPPLALEARGVDVVARPAAGDLDVSAQAGALRIDALGRGEEVERVAVDARLSAEGI